MPTLSNMPTNLLAPDALLKRALTYYSTTVRKVALLGTLLILIVVLSSFFWWGHAVLKH